MMHIFLRPVTAVLALCQIAAAARMSAVRDTAGNIARHDTNSLGRAAAAIAPKIMIISLFDAEANAWYTNWPTSGLPSLFALNLTVPGLSPLFPAVHCTADHTVCQLTTGESEINAAATMTALLLSSRFDLRRTYFLSAGIAGVSPKHGTLGGVALARFAVQVALQYEFDAREMPANFSTGYVGYGTKAPNLQPLISYGTEVFELNAALRDAAVAMARRANLTDDAGAIAYRSKYIEAGRQFAAATSPPGVVKCDTATSDVYYSGQLLSEAFENTTRTWTGGQGVYCMTAQEDNATLEAILRMAVYGLVDYSRVIVMRTGSDFDRPPPSVTPYEHLLLLDQNGFAIATQNLYLAGVEIVKGILAEWDCTYMAGIKPTNYIGDIFGTLGGEPGFGAGSIFGGVGMKPGEEPRHGNLRRRGSKGRGFKRGV